RGDRLRRDADAVRVGAVAAVLGLRLSARPASAPGANVSLCASFPEKLAHKLTFGGHQALNCIPERATATTGSRQTAIALPMCANIWGAMAGLLLHRWNSDLWSGVANALYRGPLRN